ncbi:MAG: phosphoribosylaminoimidazolesuccinocarboxamide synthase [bacterium]
MAFIPEVVKKSVIIESLKESLISQGKVGDRYLWQSQKDDFIVTVRSDRLSVFDFVLPLEVPHKGAVLTALPDFWERKISNKIKLSNHLAFSDFYPDQNMVKDLADIYHDIDLTRTIVVKRAEIMPYELIFRGHLGGSVWTSYQESQTVAGYRLPSGLHKWEKLNEPLFTPSTKANEGHDVNISAMQFYDSTGELGIKTIEILSKFYRLAYDYALSRGISILDTKFEVGTIDGQLTLCDEWLTPDSSRYVYKDDLEMSIKNKTEPAFLDKQPVREFCSTIKTPFKDKNGDYITGLKDLDPENADHQFFVASYDYPLNIVTETTERYLKIFKILTGHSLFEYQHKYLL